MFRSVRPLYASSRSSTGCGGSGPARTDFSIVARSGVESKRLVPSTSTTSTLEYAVIARPDSEMIIGCLTLASSHTLLIRYRSEEHTSELQSRVDISYA